jgi:ribosomal protein S18 acetylase RimI-like enzyme
VLFSATTLARGYKKGAPDMEQDVVSIRTARQSYKEGLEFARYVDIAGVIVGMASGYTAEQHSESSDLPLMRASGSRFRRMIGLQLLSFISRILGDLDEHAYYVQFLAVDAAARGRGIGTKLLAFMENRSQSYCCQRLSIDVSARNTGAHRLYARRRLKIVSEWPRLPLLPRVVYRMDKVL